MVITVIVEDGTQVANANSYISLVDANTYFANQGNQGAQWAAPDALKNEYLVNATVALDSVYGRQYQSYLRSQEETTQSLLWPREVFWDRHNRRHNFGSIPQVLKDAQCEMALLLQQGVDLFPEGRTDVNVTADSVKVGDISVSNTYQRSPEEQATYDGFRKIELILWPILRSKKKAMRFTL